jgi:hypothetical protein
MDEPIIDQNIKHEQKRTILLKFINGILLNIQGDKYKEITDLKDFKAINRTLIISKENDECFEKMKDELFKVFDRKAMGYYRRAKLQHYILTFLRYACADIGLKFSVKKKTVTVKCYTESHYFYTII